MQFEIVAVLGLLALFTHVHLFWVAALLLAFIDLPEFGKPLDRMAGSLEAIAGATSAERAAAEAAAAQAVEAPKEAVLHSVPADGVGEHTEQAGACTGERKELIDA